VPNKSLPRKYQYFKGPANQIFKFDAGDTLVRIFYTPAGQEGKQNDLSTK